MNLVLVIMNSTATLGGVYCLDYLHIALENDIYPDKNEQILPKYVSLVVMREKQHLVFEKREEKLRKYTP